MLLRGTSPAPNERASLRRNERLVNSNAFSANTRVLSGNSSERMSH